MILGIDLGTTNSAVGIWRDGRAELIPNSLGHVLTPSAVSIDEDGSLIVGLPARERQVSHPDRTATAFKRFMGTARASVLGKRRFLPEELSALVLSSLKKDAEAHLGTAVTDAIITVPAYFNDKQRKATRRAGELAGLKVERLINEPTAAALAYGIHETGRDSRFLVFDLGGGTFDVSIVEIFEGVIEVRASTGDNQLGGEDFNELLIDAMYQQHRGKLGVSERPQVGVLYEHMRAQAERARRALSSNEQGVMRVKNGESMVEHTIAADEFEKLAEPLLQRLREPVLRALKDGDIHSDQLESVILVGGATRMPIVKRTVTKMFGRFPDTRLDPDQAVALGAAVQAGLKARDAALKEVVLTDVCPYSLGVEISEPVAGAGLRTGIFAPIIERNTVVPTSRERVFATLHDGQPSVELNVYQGESRLVKDNIPLGKLSVPVPRRKAGEVAIECRFSYDISGLLEVDVHVPLTEERHQLTIVDDRESMNEAEVQKRRAALVALKVHPREQDQNRAALARAARCFEQLLGDQRTAVGQWISQFESVLERQEPREIESSRAAFLKALDTVDGKSYL